MSTERTTDVLIIETIRELRAERLKAEAALEKHRVDAAAVLQIEREGRMKAVATIAKAWEEMLWLDHSKDECKPTKCMCGLDDLRRALSGGKL